MAVLEVVASDAAHEKNGGSQNMAKKKASEEERLLSLAHDGDVSAQVHLGWAYGHHGDLGINIDKASHWLSEAAKSGKRPAIKRYARFLFDENDSQAVALAEDLVSSGEPYGHFLLGHIYARGSCGKPSDERKALVHFHSAEKLGHIVSGIDAIKLQSRYPLLNSKFRGKLIKLVARLVRTYARNPHDDTIFR